MIEPTGPPNDDEDRALKAVRDADEDRAHAARAEDNAVRASSWHEVDVPGIMDAGLALEAPSILHRSDGKALLYPGKTHSFVGEPESGKTWLALAATDEVLRAGGHTFYVDFEDSPKGVLRRLSDDLGVPKADVGKRFHYIQPHAPITAPYAEKAIQRTGRGATPDLVVLDGVTECMALHNWDINSATDVARFLDWFPRLWERSGAAVVLIDHVVKSGDGGRWAIGSQHKLAGVNGASYTFTVDEPFGRGRTGSASIGVAKDREGAVREFAEDDGKAAGVFYLVGSPGGSVRWELTPYDENARLLTVEEKIMTALADGPLNKGQLFQAVKGKRNLVWQAVNDLEETERVSITKQGREHLVELRGTG